jgi:hypothetical protein
MDATCPILYSAAVTTPAASAPKPPAFFGVSERKLVVMTIGTLGLYPVYWFYKNWRLVGAREAGISPFWRTFVYPLYAPSLLARMRSAGLAAGAGDFAAGPLGTAFAALSIGMAFMPLQYAWIGLLSGVLLVPAQRVANRLNAIAAPQADPNGRFSAGNIAAIAACALLAWLLALALRALAALNVG